MIGSVIIGLDRFEMIGLEIIRLKVIGLDMIGLEMNRLGHFGKRR